jgi:signal transduction histidine kinase
VVVSVLLGTVLYMAVLLSIATIPPVAELMVLEVLGAGSIPIALLLLIYAVERARDVVPGYWYLQVGLVFYYLSSLTDLVDEVAVMPLAVELVFEHASAIVATAFIVIAMAQLADHYREQRRIIDARNEELEREHALLVRQNERLEEFTSIVSHDLRNPLAVANGSLQLYRETDDEANLDRLSQALGRMERLIDDLLSLARQGKVVEEPAPVELAPIARTAWADASGDPAALSIPEGVVLFADPARLEQLFGNLFRNARQHAGPDVSVVVERLPDGFAVEDDGPGLPPDAREEVFTRGYTTAADGNGMGLSIVQRIAEAHGWAVRAADNEGGARFEFTGVELR